MQIQEQKRHSETADSESPGFLVSLRQLRTIGWTSAMFALLQSLCTAVLTISGIRVAIGLSALAAASGIRPGKRMAPGRHSHPDADRCDRRSRGQSRGPRVDSPPPQSPICAVEATRTDPATKTIRAPSDRPRDHYAASRWSRDLDASHGPPQGTTAALQNHRKLHLKRKNLSRRALPVPCRCARAAVR